METQVLTEKGRSTCSYFKADVYRISGTGSAYSISLPFQREKLKSLLAAKEKQHEESLRTIEALKNRFKYFEVQRSLNYFLLFSVFTVNSGKGPGVGIELEL